MCFWSKTSWELQLFCDFKWWFWEKINISYLFVDKAVQDGHEQTLRLQTTTHMNLLHLQIQSHLCLKCSDANAVCVTFALWPERSWTGGHRRGGSASEETPSARTRRWRRWRGWRGFPAEGWVWEWTLPAWGDRERYTRSMKPWRVFVWNKDNALYLNL